MHTVDHAFHTNKSHNHVRHLTLWQIACFLLLIGLVCVNEAADLPARVQGIPPSPADWTSVGILSLGILVVGAAGIAPLHLRRNKGKDSVTVCSYCRRIQVSPQDWRQIEAYFAEHSSLTLSHGVCPDCGAKVMHDYRCGRANAGARETIQNEVFV